MKVTVHTEQIMNNEVFRSIFLSKCEQIRIRICLYLLKKFSTENFIFLCAVSEVVAGNCFEKIQ